MLSVIRSYYLPLVRSEDGAAFVLQTLALPVCFMKKKKKSSGQDRRCRSLRGLNLFFLFGFNKLQWQERKRMNELETDDTFIYVNTSLRIILRGGEEWCVASASFTQ